MATNKRITDVDFLDSLNSDESFFVNQNNTLKQINKSNIIFDITNGGTGASDAITARNNLGITPANIGVYTKAEVDSAINAVKATGISVCTHTKTGSVHSLVGDTNVDNLKFTATADFVDGDTFTLNGNEVEAKTADGEPVCSGIFVANSVVMCFVAKDGTLFFKGGASSGNGKLPIIVKADTGSTVTCSNGTVTKSLIASEGQCMFKNMDVGTWTIVSTLNNKEKTVTYELKTPEVEILYLKYLYNNGDEFEDVTGGWVSIASTVGNPAVTNRVNDGITWVQAQTSGSGAYVTANPIDLTLFDTIEFQGNWNSNGTGNIIVISDDFIEWNDWDKHTILSVPIEEIDWDNENTNPTVDPVQSVNISALTGSYRIGIGLTGTSENASIVRMANLKLK